MTTSEKRDLHFWLRFWGAVHRYTASCGGDPEKDIYGNTGRQEAVNEIETLVDQAVSKARKTELAAQKKVLARRLAKKRADRAATAPTEPRYDEAFFEGVAHMDQEAGVGVPAETESTSELERAKAQIAELRDPDMPGADHAADVAYLINHSNMGWDRASRERQHRQNAETRLRLLEQELVPISPAFRGIASLNIPHLAALHGLEGLQITAPEPEEDDDQ